MVLLSISINLLLGALSWFDHLLCAGSLDKSIVNYDVRIKNAAVSTYLAHQGEVCSIAWNSRGYFASGGNDNAAYIWDHRYNDYIFNFHDHTAAVKAIAWSPHRQEFLATGGGNKDKSIRVWNTRVGTCLKTINTGSQVLFDY